MTAVLNVEEGNKIKDQFVTWSNCLVKVNSVMVGQ